MIKLKSTMLWPLAVMTMGASSLSAALTYTIEGAVFNPHATDHVSNGSLNLNTSDSITFNTSNNTFSGAVSGTGGNFEDANGSQYSVFNFDTINIGSGVTINVTGNRGLALLSQSQFSLNSSLILDGNDATETISSLFGNASNGGNLSLVAGDSLFISSLISVNGGNGINGEVAPVANPSGGHQTKAGANGGNLSLAALSLNLTGSLSSSGGVGGNGGNGGNGDSFFGTSGRSGQNGQAGGDGGSIDFYITGETAIGDVARGLGGNGGYGGSGVSPLFGGPRGRGGNGGNGITAGRAGGGNPRGTDGTVVDIHGTVGSLNSFATTGYLSASSVPEPSSFLLSALAGMVAIVRRKRLH